jgi:hypothetical protein
MLLSAMRLLDSNTSPSRRHQSNQETPGGTDPEAGATGEQWGCSLARAMGFGDHRGVALKLECKVKSAIHSSSLARWRSGGCVPPTICCFV